MLDTPVIKSLMQEDDAFGDSTAGVNLFDGNVPGSAGTGAAGVGDCHGRHIDGRQLLASRC